VVHEVNPGRGGLVPQNESRMRSISNRPTRPAIQSHCEQQRCEKWNGQDGAPNGGIGSMQH
jgi:hypothetical protein